MIYLALLVIWLGGVVYFCTTLILTVMLEPDKKDIAVNFTKYFFHVMFWPITIFWVHV